MTDTPADPSRRDFLHATALIGTAGMLAPLDRLAPAAEPTGALRLAAPAMETVRIGFVGVGGMGMVHIENLLTLEGVEIKAICDIVPEKVVKAQEMVMAAGMVKPTGYDSGPRDFERMCAEEELDLVYTATPWEWHVPVLLAAMNNDKHAATEVPAAYTVEDCWALVEAAEKNRKHCVMQENCIYDRLELLALNMVRQGVLGELLHGEGGYLHDLRSIKFSTEGEGLWRRAHAIRRNGNLYPTHGLGPIAMAMDINRGNRFDYLVSMSGPSRGLQQWQQEHLPADDPRRRERYLLGDINVTIIQTTQGQTIHLMHDTNLPRPYSRGILLQGTKGLIQGWPSRAYIEGKSPTPHQWEPLDRYYTEYEHPLWKSEKVKEMRTGHGGMDWLEDYRLITCLRNGLPTDQNVYDAAAWSVIAPLTERSAADKAGPVDVPDFTRGKWLQGRPWEIIEG